MTRWRLKAALLLAMLSSIALAAEESAEAPPAPPEKALPALKAPTGTRDRLIGLAQAGSRLVAVGQAGGIYLSDDGKAWRQAAAPVSTMLTAVRFRDDSHGWAVGYDGSILNSADGGKTWSLRHWDPHARMLYDILFIDAQRGIAVGGYGSYLATSDGGGTWTPQSFPITELGQHFNRLVHLVDGTLFLAGERGLLARSEDEGASWKMLQSPYAGSFFGALALDAARVLVYGMRGNVYVTENVRRCPTQDPAKYDPYTAQTVTDAARMAKLGWRKIEVPTRESLFNATRLNDGSVLLVGVNGVALKLDPELKTATPVAANAAETLADVAHYRGRLLAVGRRGVQDLGALP